MKAARVRDVVVVVGSDVAAKDEFRNVVKQQAQDQEQGQDRIRQDKAGQDRTGRTSRAQGPTATAH